MNSILTYYSVYFCVILLLCVGYTKKEIFCFMLSDITKMIVFLINVHTLYPLDPL